eukprot:130110_1
MATGSGLFNVEWSVGDTIQIGFDVATDQSGNMTASEIYQLFSFSESLGPDIQGQWLNPSKLQITAGTNLTGASPLLGSSTVRVIGGLLIASGGSLNSSSESPALSGSFGSPPSTDFSGTILIPADNISMFEDSSPQNLSAYIFVDVSIANQNISLDVSV